MVPGIAREGAAPPPRPSACWPLQRRLGHSHSIVSWCHSSLTFNIFFSAQMLIPPDLPSTWCFGRRLVRWPSIDRDRHRSARKQLRKDRSGLSTRSTPRALFWPRPGPRLTSCCLTQPWCAGSHVKRRPGVLHPASGGSTKPRAMFIRSSVLAQIAL